MIQKTKTYLRTVASDLRAVVDGLQEQNRRAEQLTTALNEVAGRIQRMTDSLDYLAASERTKNHRSGIQVQ